MAQLDTVLTYLVVILAVGFITRPLLYKLIGRQAPSSACHSNSSSACDGGGSKITAMIPVRHSL